MENYACIFDIHIIRNGSEVSGVGKNLFLVTEHRKFGLRCKKCRQPESGLLYSNQLKLYTMLRYAIIIFVIDNIAGALGFGGIAGAMAGIAEIVFYIFLVLLVVSLLSGLLKKA